MFQLGQLDYWSFYNPVLLRLHQNHLWLQVPVHSYVHDHGHMTMKRVINALLNEKRELKWIWNCFMKLVGECSGHAAGFSQNLKQVLGDLSCEHTCSPRSTLHFCADDADSSGVTRWLRHNGFVNKQSFSKSWYVFVCTDLSLICVIIVDISTH